MECRGWQPFHAGDGLENKWLFNFCGFGGDTFCAFSCVRVCVSTVGRGVEGDIAVRKENGRNGEISVSAFFSLSESVCV